MPIFVGAIYRVLPLIVALVALAAVVFVLVFTTKGLDKAKEVMLKMFWLLSAVGSVAFGLITLYAFCDGNMNMGWLFASCLIVFLLAWLIDYLCLRRFRKNHQDHEFFRISFKKREKKSKKAADKVEFEVEDVISEAEAIINEAAKKAESDQSDQSGPDAEGK